MNALRMALEQRIAQNFAFDQHADQLNTLRDEFNHSIFILPFEEPLQDYNCVMFALDLHLEEPSNLLGRFYANTQYLKSLVIKGFLQEGDVRSDSLVVYMNGEIIEHVGIARGNGRIVSKWGIGFLYEHCEWEVPTSYGNEIRYYEPIDPDIAFEQLKVFHGWLEVHN